MAVRKILQLGDPILKQKCEKVENIDKEILDLIKDMKDTLYESGGIGLAAPQIGVLKRVVFIDLGGEDDEPMVLINPEIIEKKGKETSVEGCLSYVGFEGELERPKKVKVRALNEKGQEVIYVGEELLGKCFCHELDHLDGIMYVDRASRIYKLED
jgi:peptide deformylase